MVHRIRPALSALGAAWLALTAAAAEPGRELEYEQPPISYSSTKPQDPVARLVQRIAAREVLLDGSDQSILRAVLRELDIPAASQVTVFSRTSLQARLIRPNNPRAIYFSDSTYVGWVPGGLIEVAAIDPQLGPVFYAFDPQDARDARRSFVREKSCLGCHVSNVTTGGIPGLFAHSLFTAVTGEPVLRREGIVLTEQTPFAQRWGGWYVTGYTGEQNHRGNAFSRAREGVLDFTPTDARPTELSRYLDTSRYLVDTSDVVALLVFEHQLAMHNSLARASHRARLLLAQSPAAGADQRTRLLASLGEDVLDHLLFRETAPLPEGVEGGAAFREAFLRNAPRDARGHTLKDLSLPGRLFANRCSFLIYSESFTTLPAPLKDMILDRLHAALRDTDPASRYAYLEKEEKQRILAILTATHPDARRRFTAAQ